MEYKSDINKNIFRGYDIRGVVPSEIDVDTAYTIGLGFGSHIKSLGKLKCVVGYDNRLSSPSLFDALVKGILSTGVDVVSLGLCTTPMYYYSWSLLGIYSGVMVTASHNPKDDNGFKFAFDESGNTKGEEIQDFLKFILKGEFSKGAGKFTTYDIENEYFDLMKRSLSFGDRRLKVVIDPGNGTTSIIAKKLYSLFPIDLYCINDISDGTFPNHHPDPCVESNLEQLKSKVLEVGADIGLSFDGDGDRMGMVTSNGTFIKTDEFMIIVIRDIFNKVDKKEFLYDVKCSKSLSDEIIKLGGKGICYRTGNSYTKGKLLEDNLPFGGELSGHIYFNDKFLGFDSGLYAGLRMLEILSLCDKSVEDLLVGINKYISTDELKFTSSDDRKFSIINKVLEYSKKRGYEVLDIDGCKVLFEDGWALVRASNTGPNITARFEASTEDRLKEIQSEFVSLIDDLNIEVL